MSVGQGCSGNALEAVDYPGAEHMGHLSRLLHGLGADFLRLRPDQALILDGNTESYESHIQALVSDEGDLALIYSAGDGRYGVDLSRLAQGVVAAQWYNLRTDQFHPGEEPVAEDGSQFSEYDPPGALGAGHDWVLMLNVAHTFTQSSSVAVSAS